MGNCCSSDADRTVLLLTLADGSVKRKSISNITMFRSGSTDFEVTFTVKAGPLCSFGVSRSPDGLKPLTPADVKSAEKALRKHELYHGGEQCLFAAWCTVDDAKKAVVIVTSLGRLFSVAGGKVVNTLHATHLRAAELVSGAGDLRLILEGGGQMSVSSSPVAAAQLQQMLWVAHSVAHGELALTTNMSKLPMHLLPPQGVADGNLHAAYTMHANAKGIMEPELVLRSGMEAADVTTALQCIRGWASMTEVDASDWRPEMVAPLARGLARNEKFVAFRMCGMPFGSAVADLAPMVAANRRMVSLVVSGVGGTPDAMGRLGTALASNPASLLSVLDLSHNEIRDDGAILLANGLRALRAGLLAELNLSCAQIDEAGMSAVLGSLHAQKNLLQLQLSGNVVGPGEGSTLLAALLPRVAKLEVLGLGSSRIDADVAFGSVETDLFNAKGPLSQMSSLDLSGMPWNHGLLGAVQKCGEKLTALNLASGALSSREGDKASFLRALATLAAGRPALDLDLSTPDAGTTLLPELLSVLQGGGALLPSLTLRSGGTLGDDGLTGLVEALTTLSRQAHAAGGAGVRKLDVSLSVPQVGAVINSWSLDETNAQALISQLSGAALDLPAVLARWGIRLPPGTEAAAARRVGSVAALTKLVREPTC